MRFVDSRCKHCGATLRVADGATQVRCQYCDSEVHIVRNEGHSAAEVNRPSPDGISQKLDVLRIQNEIERIDREWALQQGGKAVQGKQSAPPIAAIFIGAIFIVVGLCFGTLWVSVTLGNTPIFFTGFGVLVCSLFVVFGITAMVGAKSHGAAMKNYQAMRHRLLDELARAQTGAQTAHE